MMMKLMKMISKVIINKSFLSKYKIANHNPIITNNNFKISNFPIITKNQNNQKFKRTKNLNQNRKQQLINF